MHLVRVFALRRSVRDGELICSVT